MFRLLIVLCAFFCGTISQMIPQNFVDVNVLYLDNKTLAVQIHNQSDYEISIYTSLEEGDMQSAIYFDLLQNNKDSIRMQFYSLQQPELKNVIIKIAPHQTYVRKYQAGKIPLLNWSFVGGAQISSEDVRFLRAHLYLKYRILSPTEARYKSFYKEINITTNESMENNLFQLFLTYKPQTRELIFERYNRTGNTIKVPSGILVGNQKDSCLYVTYKNEPKREKLKCVLKDSASIVYARLSDLLKEDQYKGTNVRMVVVSSSFYYQKDGNRKWEHYQHLDTLNFPPQDKINYFTNKTDSNGMYFLFGKVAERLAQNKVQAKNTNKQSDQADLKKRFAPYMESTNKFESDWANDVILGDTVYESVDRMPEFPGGQSALLNYISENLKYPEHFNDQVRVIIKVIVEKDGTLSHARVMRRSTYLDTDREALKVIMSMPNWTPGYKDGKPVRTYFTIPVMFRLQ